MTPLQKRVFLALAIVIALSRFLALAHSLFDWDEALFALGVREYDVVSHHPHPPGYPLFIAAAKLVHFAGVEEFRSVQTIVMLGAMLLFPALYWLGREIGFGFTTSAAGAAIFSFLPNVWIYGGTGFSDIPAATLALTACALLLRGRSDRRAYLLGAVVLGIAAGLRPASMVVAALPALMATWRRLRARDFLAVVAAVVLGGAIVAASYLGAARATGSVQSYFEAVRTQSEYVRKIDSWRNPERPPLHEVAKYFFLMPVQQKAQMHGLALLALVSLVASVVRRRAAPLLTFAIFAPIAVLAWLSLDFEAAGRYAIPYLAAYALLVADALSLMARRRVVAQSILAAMVVAVFVIWTWPALRLQRTSDAPPMGALGWVKRNVPPGASAYVHFGLLPQAEYAIPGRFLLWYETSAVSPPGEALLVNLKIVPEGHNFVWSRSNPMWKIVRRRNFEISVAHVTSLIGFVSGWYGEEGDLLEKFRWMAASSTATLPAVEGMGRLRLKLSAPIDNLPVRPQIEVVFNGVLVERFTPSEGVNDKSWVLPSRKGQLNDLRITTSHTMIPSKVSDSPDTRELGLRVDAFSWTPAD